MILTSYFDESGTHGGSPVTIIAGIIATANQWHRFQSEIDKIKDRYGFRIFHAKEFKDRSGEFKGWSAPKCLSLINEMADLTDKSFMKGIVFSLDNEQYHRQYKGSDTPRKLRLDTKYGLAFRYCLTALIAEAVRRLSTHKRFPDTRMHIVLESGHPNAGDASRIFVEMQREMQQLGSSLLDSITFANKRQRDPLMVADFLAHTTFMMGNRRLDPGQFQIEPGPYGRSGLTHIGFELDGLADLKAQLIARLKSRKPSGASPVSAASGRPCVS